MSTDPINTMPIQQLIQMVKVAEQSRAKEVRLDITQAKTLAFTLGEVMARLHGDLEKILDEKIDKLNQDQTIEINMDSGGW
jgi:CRISPR/Cas system CSM-associated protein Csm2 small subunit